MMSIKISELGNIFVSGKIKTFVFNASTERKKGQYYWYCNVFGNNTIYL